MKKRAATARGDLLHGAPGAGRRCRFFMPAVMVKISGEVDLYVDGVAGKHFFAKENQVGLVEDAPRGPVFLRVDPHWRSQTQNHLVAGLHVLPDDLAEVLDLRDIEIALKL